MRTRTADEFSAAEEGGGAAGRRPARDWKGNSLTLSSTNTLTTLHPPPRARTRAQTNSIQLKKPNQISKHHADRLGSLLGLPDDVVVGRRRFFVGRDGNGEDGREAPSCDGAVEHQAERRWRDRARWRRGPLVVVVILFLLLFLLQG